MNEVWNLDPIYLGFQDPAFENDFAALKQAVSEFAAFIPTLADAEPLQGLKEGIAHQEKLMTLGSKLVEYAMLRQAANTVDPEAGSRVGQIMAALSSVAAPQARFQEWASKLPDLMELVARDEILTEYTFLFENMKEGSRFLLPGLGEEVRSRVTWCRVLVTASALTRSSRLSLCLEESPARVAHGTRTRPTPSAQPPAALPLGQNRIGEFKAKPLR